MNTVVINVPKILLILVTYYIIWLILHFLLDKIEGNTKQIKQTKLLNPFRDLKSDTIKSYMIFAIIVTFIYCLLYVTFDFILSFNYILTF